ncbi:venom acid phosphatase Acph-1-like [Photinus pyralis]|uniref:venom acid phosphatase Acph-1-like n=1 Tax=Photinus pyralis TaxID=7054 RepID=UPI00126719CA|nr:venom acid phosphatase Acph-1-like [Photinus pyralis]
MHYFNVLICVFCVVGAHPNQTACFTDELILLNVLFRHGDRTPDAVEMYPNDPYNDESFFVEGFGQLTKKGKNREYHIGRSLRQMYGEFLGLYKTNEVSATTTDYIRTKMSCLLVLAGLYPPSGKEVWRDDLSWQPVAYSYNPAGKDYLLGDPFFDCPNYRPLYEEHLRSKQAVALINSRKPLYEFLSLHTGMTMTVPRDPYYLQLVLTSEENIGLKLPGWTKNVWPGNITDAGVDEYYVNLATPKMQRLAGGVFVKKLLDDIENKIRNRQNPMKIYLYSAHEYNLAYQLIFMDVFDMKFPPYGSYIVYEVRRVNKVYGVKIRYEDYSKKDGPRYLKIPHCGVFCPLSKFIKMLQKYVPLLEDVCTS